MSSNHVDHFLRTDHVRRTLAFFLVYTLVFDVGFMPTPLRAQTLSNNTVHFMSDNQITIKDNNVFTSVSMTNNVRVGLQLAGGPWGAVAGSVYGLIANQMA